MASAVYSCGTCRVKFPTLDMMQNHYKCDWHRYNLKRKVAELPPISAENFAEILKAYQSNPTKKGLALGYDPNLAGGGQGDKLYCNPCAKSFLNSGSFASHLESKKHIDRSREFELGNDDLDKIQPASVSELKDAVANEVVMETDSSTDAPEGMAGDEDWEDVNDDIDDLPPFDVTLCLYCSRKSTSLETNIDHMSSAHSFFIPDLDYCCDLAGLIDYLGKKIRDGHTCLYCNQRTFQDGTSVQRHMESKGHAKMAYDDESLLEYEDFYDFSIEIESESGVRFDGEGGEMDGTGYEMTLPSGATIGHRDLNRYYKQSLGAVKDVALVSRVAGHYKALGWKPNEQGMGYAKDMLGKLNRLKKDDYKKRLHLGMQTNKIMMERYRRQYGF